MILFLEFKFEFFTFPTFPIAVPIRVVVEALPKDDVNRLAVPFRRDEGGRAPKLKMWNVSAIGNSYFENIGNY